MLRNMSLKRAKFGSVLGLAAVLTLTGGIAAANAEVEDSVDAALVESSLTYLGLENVSDELTQTLVEGVDAATDAGIVPDTLIEAVIQNDAQETGAEPNTADSASETPPLDPTLEGLFDEQLDLDQERWDESGPLWLAAFETIRADFDTCRGEGQSASQCARTMAFSLQVAQAEALLAQLDQRVLELAELPAEQQEQARAELEAERVALEARLLRAETRLASVSSAQTGARPERVVELLASVRDKAQATRGGSSEQVVPPGQQPGTASTNQPAPTSQPAPQTVSPQGGNSSSAKPETKPTPGSQGNRSQTPGANAGANGNGGSNR